MTPFVGRAVPGFALQGEKVRVTGEQPADLQATIALLRQSSFDRSLQFENFRD